MPDLRTSAALVTAVAVCAGGGLLAGSAATGPLGLRPATSAAPAVAAEVAEDEAPVVSVPAVVDGVGPVLVESAPVATPVPETESDDAPRRETAASSVRREVRVEEGPVDVDVASETQTRAPVETAPPSVPDAPVEPTPPSVPAAPVEPAREAAPAPAASQPAVEESRPGRGPDGEGPPRGERPAKARGGSPGNPGNPGDAGGGGEGAGEGTGGDEGEGAGPGPGAGRGAGDDGDTEEDQQ